MKKEEDAYLKIDDIYRGYSETIMGLIRPESITLSVWSPPYFVGKAYEKDATYDSWQMLLREIIEKHASILKAGGFMVINIADILSFKDAAMPKIQADVISNKKCPITKEDIIVAKKEHPNYNRYELAALLGCSEQTIDRRLNGNNIRGGKYETQTRVKLVGGKLEEYAYKVGLFLYDKRIWIKDPTWANSKWVSNTYKAVSETEDLYIFWKPGEHVIDHKKLSKKEWTEWGHRQTWKICSVRKNDDHEAKFPVELVSRIIRLFSNEGDIILDPFVGSGTTAIAALMNKRHFIGIDKEAKYVALAKKNVANARLKLDF